MVKKSQTEQWWEDVLTGELSDEDWVKKIKKVRRGTSYLMYNFFQANIYDHEFFYNQFENQIKKIDPLTQVYVTARKIKLCIKDFFSICDQVRRL